MSLIDRVLGRPNGYSPAGVTFLDFADTSSSTSASIAVSEHSSLGMAAVWRAVNLIASGCASLPLHPYKQVAVEGRTDLVRQLQTTGQGATLLAKPHPDLPPFELWEIVYAHIALWGNAYLFKMKDADDLVTELWPIHPSRVTPGRASDGAKVYLLDGSQGGQDSFGDDRILHIPGFGYDGIAGLSPISLARQGIGLAMAAEKFGARLFGSGSIPSGLLIAKDRLTQEKANELKAGWRARVSGVGNSHDIAVLDSGVEYKQLTIPPEDAQFIQSRAFQIEEVARIYGVPPHMLMSVEKSTSWGAGIEQQSLGFVTYTLRPWLTRGEQRVSTVLTPNTVYAKYALEGLLRGDSAQRAAYYKTMRELGALSPNEIRAYEELPPIEGGDSYIAPMNFAPLAEDPGADPAATEGSAA